MSHCEVEMAVPPPTVTTQPPPDRKPGPHDPPDGRPAQKLPDGYRPSAMYPGMTSVWPEETCTHGFHGAVIT